MNDFSERRVGNWTFEAYGLVMPLPADLTQRVKRPVPNRAERRQAIRDARRDFRRSASAAHVERAPVADDVIGDVSNWQPSGVQQ